VACRRPLVILAIAATVGAACSSSSSDESSTSSRSSLRPAGEVSAEEEATEAKDVAVGETVTLDKGVTVKVTNMSVGGDDLGPWLTVGVHAENKSGESTTNPEVAIHCKGEPEAGGWQADSTYSLGDELPAGSFAEGSINLLLPEDSRTGEPTPACDEPATVRVTELGVTVGNERPKSFDYPIESALVEQLNAKRTQ
jgi:hypothetical protein